MQISLLTLSVLLLPRIVLFPTQAQSTPELGISFRICLNAAKKALGSDAEVLKCGHLTGTQVLETVAAVPLKPFQKTSDGVPVSRFSVLRRETSEWVSELTADDHPLRNPSGYLSVDFIDDSDKYGRYRVSFYDEGSHKVPGFTIAVFYLSPDGHNEGVPVEIRWNPSVRRFQEYTENQDPGGFQPENKNPKHIRTLKPK
jgi:hypothetical protein